MKWESGASEGVYVLYGNSIRDIEINNSDEIFLSFKYDNIVRKYSSSFQNLGSVLGNGTRGSSLNQLR